MADEGLLRLRVVIVGANLYRPSVVMGRKNGCGGKERVGSRRFLSHVEKMVVFSAILVFSPHNNNYMLYEDVCC